MNTRDKDINRRRQLRAQLTTLYNNIGSTMHAPQTPPPQHTLEQVEPAQHVPEQVEPAQHVPEQVDNQSRGDHLEDRRQLCWQASLDKKA